MHVLNTLLFPLCVASAATTKQWWFLTFAPDDSCGASHLVTTYSNSKAEPECHKLPSGMGSVNGDPLFGAFKAELSFNNDCEEPVVFDGHGCYSIKADYPQDGMLPFKSFRVSHIIFPSSLLALKTYKVRLYV